MRSVKIFTQNKELYHKLSSLNFYKEIIIDKENAKSINRIINSINKTDIVVSKEIIGDKIKIKKHSNINFNVYFQ